jgi:hypothetical protein
VSADRRPSKSDRPRLYSAYWFARFNGWENAPTFEEALALEPQRLEGSYDEQTELTYLSRALR